MDSSLGWGLFCRKKINVGEVIGVFTDELRYQQRNMPIASEHVFLKDYGHDQFQLIDAANSGNITRFMQHLPSAELVKMIKMSQQIKLDIAVENIRKELYEFSLGHFTEKYIAITDIGPGEIIGCCYDLQFWLDRMTALFYKNGSLVPVEKYKYPGCSMANPKIRTYLAESSARSPLFFSNSITATGFLMVLAALLLYKYEFFIAQINQYYGLSSIYSSPFKVPFS